MKKELKRLYLAAKMVVIKSPSAVLMLHSINADTYDNTGVNLSRDRFIELIDTLTQFNHIGDVVTGAKPGIALSFDDGRNDIYDEIYPYLKKKQIPFTIFITYNFLDKDGYLTKKQLIELANDKLVTIGSHCLNHVALAQQPLENQYNEIVESKRKIEELIQKPIEYIAYPYGQYNQDTIKILNNNGIYKYAFTAGGWFISKGQNGYLLDRMNISNKYYKENFDLLKQMKNRWNKRERE